MKRIGDVETRVKKLAATLDDGVTEFGPSSARRFWYKRKDGVTGEVEVPK